MSIGRGLFRLWTFASVLWMASIGLDAWNRSPTVEDAELAFLPPLFVLALGTALGWALRGFRQ